jgi:hypothetical protein
MSGAGGNGETTISRGKPKKLGIRPGPLSLRPLQMSHEVTTVDLEAGT